MSSVYRISHTNRVKLAKLATSEENRYTPRTCTAECANAATWSGDFGKLPTYVADLTIDPVAGQADFSNSVPILY